jgi:hypothetical protein
MDRKMKTDYNIVDDGHAQQKLVTPHTRAVKSVTP